MVLELLNVSSEAVLCLPFVSLILFNPCRMRDREVAHNEFIPTQDGIPHWLDKEGVESIPTDFGIIHCFAGNDLDVGGTLVSAICLILFGFSTATKGS